MHCLILRWKKGNSKLIFSTEHNMSLFGCTRWCFWQSSCSESTQQQVQVSPTEPGLKSLGLLQLVNLQVNIGGTTLSCSYCIMSSAVCGFRYTVCSATSGATGPTAHWHWPRLWPCIRGDGSDPRSWFSFTSLAHWKSNWDRKQPWDQWRPA